MTNTHGCDILLSCPHPRRKKPESSAAPPAAASGFLRPFGLEQNRSVPPTMPAAWGLLVKSDVVDNVSAAPPETPPRTSGAPSGKADLPRRATASIPAGRREPTRAFAIGHLDLQKGSPHEARAPLCRTSCLRWPRHRYGMPRPSSTSSASFTPHPEAGMAAAETPVMPAP